jgi:hypothetical protein
MKPRQPTQRARCQTRPGQCPDGCRVKERQCRPPTALLLTPFASDRLTSCRRTQSRNRGATCWPRLTDDSSPSSVSAFTFGRSLGMEVLGQASRRGPSSATERFANLCPSLTRLRGGNLHVAPLSRLDLGISQSAAGCFPRREAGMVGEGALRLTSASPRHGGA